MNLNDPRARARWRAFEHRARLALVDARPSVRRSLLADLRAHVTEALAREAPEVSEAERIERVLVRVGDPVRFLRPLLEDASRATAARRERVRPFAMAATTILSAALGIAFIAFGGGALACPRGVGLFQFGADEYQIRLFCGASAGAPLGAPWLPIASIVAGALLLGLCWRSALRVQAALLLRRSADDTE
ncbi:MAG TPA: hypothetical protein VF559_02760 [Caulobacteraceae bacterium]|jgi:hypothetical protein